MFSREYIKKIFKTVPSYTSSIIDSGYSSNDDIAIRTILVIASIILSIASGYTSFSGLIQFTRGTGFIAFLLTIGIQSLLFSVSWRLGRSFVINEYPPSLIGIWLFSMMISVFFSFSSLFDGIYTDDEKEQNRKILSMNVGQNILSEINDILKENIKAAKSNLDISKYDAWKSKILQDIESKNQDIVNQLAVKKNEHRKLNQIYEREIKSGGTEYLNKNGDKAISSPGDGDIAKILKNQSDEYKEKILDEYENKVTQYYLKKKSLLKELFDFEQNKNTKNMRNAYSICSELFSSFGYSNSVCRIEALENDIFNIDNLIEKLNKFQNECSSGILDYDFTRNLQKIRKCIEIAELNKDDREKYLDKIAKTDSREGSRTHYFITVLNELQRFNPVAWGAAILALAIDSLILLCSLVGSRHESFLNVLDRKDLMQMGEYPLNIILDSDVEFSKDDSDRIKRIKSILSKSVFSNSYSKKGFSAIISEENIISICMHKELGTFFF